MTAPDTRPETRAEPVAWAAVNRSGVAWVELDEESCRADVEHYASEHPNQGWRCVGLAPIRALTTDEEGKP